MTELSAMRLRRPASGGHDGGESLSDQMGGVLMGTGDLSDDGVRGHREDADQFSRGSGGGSGTDRPSVGHEIPGPGRGRDSATQDREGTDSDEPMKITLGSANGLGVAADGADADPGAVVEEPAKVMRIGTMVKQLLDEVKSAPLDEAARGRLAEIHQRSLHELEDGLSDDLLAELHRITLPLAEDHAPSDAELRIAQAQLVGWLEGLFHGIQTALVAQQMAAQNQLVQMRRALPSGPSAGPGQGGGQPGDLREGGTGQYL